MEIINQSFKVTYDYSVHFTEDLFSIQNPTLIQGLKLESNNLRKKALIFIDDEIIKNISNFNLKIETYFKTYNNLLELVCAPIIIEGGENIKNNFEYVNQILSYINQYNIDRHSYTIAIGGGAVLDMVGFASAIAHRGLRHIRIPSTVLSQDDSGVGVKNSINYFNKKNFLGTFVPPFAVFNDYQLLESLSNRDWIGGIAEAIKVALIKDKDFFDFIEHNQDVLRSRNKDAMQYMIKKSAELHLNHIASGDPFEKGSSRPLDFGHWAAHKLEHLSNFEIKHGEAVAAGIALDTIYSHLLGNIGNHDLLRIITLIKKIGFKIYYPEMLEKSKINNNYELLTGLDEFREHLGGKLTVMLLAEIGVGTEVNIMNSQKILEAIALLKQHQ
ncbi:MAG: 3-dehydroquinate synthase [Cytophagales bacterium]|nr:MAG: 3-dehydroquinate synthase [Cytophagales bacterium]